MTDSVEISMLAKFYVNTTYTSKDTRRQKLGKTALFHVLNKTPVLTFCRMHAMGQPHLQVWGTRVLGTYNKSDFFQRRILNSVLPMFYQKREKRSFKACENGVFLEKCMRYENVYISATAYVTNMVHMSTCSEKDKKFEHGICWPMEIAGTTLILSKHTQIFVT